MKANHDEQKVNQNSKTKSNCIFRFYFDKLTIKKHFRV